MLEKTQCLGDFVDGYHVMILLIDTLPVVSLTSID